MKYIFKRFTPSYYDKVHKFLVELSQDERIHINWNWARWEWMFFHPEFDRSQMEKIGLWFMDDELVGVAIYDHYEGEAFLATKRGFEELYREILDYAVENLSDENGLGIAVNDNDDKTRDLLEAYGFVLNDQTENVLELSLNGFDFNIDIDRGILLQCINIEKDLYKHHELLWKGFDHEGQAPLEEGTINKQKQMLSATHMKPMLHIIAKNEASEYVSYCGVWYDEETDYSYVEPVCTVPEYRNRGIAKGVIAEALRRAYESGARKAYVISDSEFYKRIGFKQHSHYTFYWFK